MNTVLLDTNIISFVIKGDTRAHLYDSCLVNQRLAISFMSVAELFQWAAIRQWGPARIKELEERLKTYLIFPFDIELCRVWGQVRALSQSKGRPISPQDAWIAATALLHKIPLVTHNPSDFTAISTLQIITVQG